MQLSPYRLNKKVDKKTIEHEEEQLNVQFVIPNLKTCQADKSTKKNMHQRLLSEDSKHPLQNS